MSALRQAAEEYLTLRRSLGYELAEVARLLPRFIEHLEARGVEVVTTKAALAWAQGDDADGPTTMAARRMAVVRGFARHMAGIDPRTEVPPVGLIPHPPCWRTPFIYTEADIGALIAEARRSMPQPLRAATYQTLIGLLAATGTRVGEAIALDQGDVDWSEGLLLVRRSKFGKSRQVPVHQSTLDALHAYARCRDRHMPRPADASFFISLRGSRLIYEVVLRTFRRLCQASGVGAGSAIRPRIHDFRHSFAVRCLLDWYQAGADVQARMVHLSTYLGHRDPRYTYWYLSAAPELLAHATRRLDAANQVVIG
jgi:integrase/recombinase XerD